VRSIHCSRRKSDLILTASADKMVCLWNTLTGNFIDSVDKLSFLPLCCHWKKDEMSFAVGQRNTVKIFDVRKLEVSVGVVTMPWDQPVHSLACSGELFVAASLGGVAVINDQQGQVGPVVCEGPVFAMAMDEQRLLCSFRLEKCVVHEVFEGRGSWKQMLFLKCLFEKVMFLGGKQSCSELCFQVPCFLERQELRWKELTR
jgi:hypothetical protein